MDRWMDGWVDGWVGGWMHDVWMQGWIDGWMDEGCNDDTLLSLRKRLAGFKSRSPLLDFSAKMRWRCELKSSSPGEARKRGGDSDTDRPGGEMA